MEEPKATQLTELSPDVAEPEEFVFPYPKKLLEHSLCQDVEPSQFVLQCAMNPEEYDESNSGSDELEEMEMSKTPVLAKTLIVGGKKSGGVKGVVPSSIIAAVSMAESGVTLM